MEIETRLLTLIVSECFSLVNAQLVVNGGVGGSLGGGGSTGGLGVLGVGSSGGGNSRGGGVVIGSGCGGGISLGEFGLADILSFRAIGFRKHGGSKSCLSYGIRPSTES